MEALFVDTFTRELKVYAVSVTKCTAGLILRFGVEVGSLNDLVKQGPFVSAIPLIITTRGYQALSSDGFVSVIHQNPSKAQLTYIVGMQGMPFFQKKSLCVLNQPQEVVVLSQLAKLSRLTTHTNSNPKTAKVARLGIDMMAELNYANSMHIVEGQSDVVRAFKITFSDEVLFLNEIEVEHRYDMFGKTELAQFWIRKYSDIQKLIFLVLATFVEKKPALGDFTGLWIEIPPSQYKTIIESAAEILEGMLGYGFSYTLTLSGDNSMLTYHTPDGKTETNFFMTDETNKYSVYLVEDYLLEYSNNSLEEKEEIRTIRRIQFASGIIREQLEINMLASSYRIVPASEISLDQESVSYILTKNLKPRVVPSLSSIISAPEFGDEAGGSNYLLISYMDNELNCIDSFALKWEGMREGFGWSILKLSDF